MDEQEVEVDGFEVRVSEALFRALAGRAASAPTIEPANEREKAIIEAVRRQESYKRQRLVSEQRLVELKAAQAREEQVTKDFKDAYDNLKKKHGDLGVFPVAVDESKWPCAKEREEAVSCFTKHAGSNPQLCTGVVDAFASCVKGIRPT